MSLSHVRYLSRLYRSISNTCITKIVARWGKFHLQGSQYVATSAVYPACPSVFRHHTPELGPCRYRRGTRCGRVMSGILGLGHFRFANLAVWSLVTPSRLPLLTDSCMLVVWPSQQNRNTRCKCALNGLFPEPYRHIIRSHGWPSGPVA